MSDYRDFNINNRSNLFVRFAADEHGTDFSDKPSQNRRYMGILATGHRLNLPIKEDFDGLWQEYVGHDGLNAEVHIDPVTHTWIINGVDTKVVAVAQDTVMAESYCHGQTLARPNEETDNAMYYKQAAEAAASVAEEAVGDIASLHEQIASQNEVIQNHIETTTSLNEEMSEKVAHVDSVLSHIDEVKSDVDTIHANVQSVVGEIDETAQQIANDKSEINTLKSNIDAAASMVSRAANQVSDDKVIIVRASEMANEYKLDAAAAAKEAASYAHGGTNTRQDEDTDNGLYYLTQTRDVATNAIGSVTADVQLVQEAQEDVTAKATLVTQTAEQVATDKSDITNMKATVVEKHDAVVTMHDHVVELQSAVETARVQVNTEYDDILAKASQVSSDTAAVSVMKDWITTNTQISHVYIDEHGVLHENRVGADLFSFSLDENGKLVVTDLKQPNRHAELGVTTAYGYAKAGGYTGTEEDFIARIQEILNATLDTFSGDYNDLTNKPTIPSKTSELTNDSNFQTAQQVQAAVSPKADASALTAHTGNTTVHITASERSSWNAKSNFSGSYDDLTNKPTIPTTAADVGAIPASEKGAANGVAQLDTDGKVDVSQFPVAGSSSGQTGGVWTAADNGVSTDSTGKLSIVQAGSDAIAGRSSSTQPIVPSNLNEAVAAAVSDSNHMTLNASQQATAQSVFHVPDIDATGSSLGLAVDPTTYVMTMTLKNASGTTIDTKTVDLPLESMVIGATCTNGVLTLTLQSGSTVNVDVSSLVSGLIPSSEKGANNGVATLGNDGKVPSAQLPTIPTSLADLTEDSTHHTVTADEKSAWNAKSDFSGDYNDLENKPAIPSKTSDLTNDSGFQTSSDIQSAVSGKANASDLTAHTGNTTIHVTAAEKEAWNGKSDFNGSYNSLTDKPTIPTQLSQLAEDSTHRTVTDAEKASWEGKSGFDGNYNNLTNKPTIPSTASDVGAIPTTEKGVANGVATLDATGKVPASQIPAVAGETPIHFSVGEDATITSESNGVLNVGGDIDQSNAIDTLAVGSNIDQTDANASAAIGYNIDMSQAVQSLAVGMGLDVYGENAGMVCFGVYNEHDSGFSLARITGGGTRYGGRKNIEELSWTGNLYIAGGYQNGVETIPAATSSFELEEKTYIHKPTSSPTYSLVPSEYYNNDTRTHRIELTVDFTNVQTYSFEDWNGQAITPISTPTITAGDIYTFKIDFSHAKKQWIIYPEKHGAISSDNVLRSEVGAVNGVASLGADGKVPSTQLPDSGLPLLSGTTNPTHGTAGNPGQLYLNTTDGPLFYCLRLDTTDNRYYWNKIHAGENVVIPKTLFLGAEDQYTHRSETTSSLAAGSSITQWMHAYFDIAFGQNIYQDGTYSLALGGTIRQEMSSGYVVSVGTNITVSSAGPALAVGDHITQSFQIHSIAVGEYISQLYASSAIAVGSHITTDMNAGQGSAYFGKYNAPVSTDSPMRVTGNGTADNARKNIEELSSTGDLYITGGYRQGITIIPADTSAYTLSEGVFTHAPTVSPTYTLPDVTDTTRTHHIELIIDFTTVQTFAFVDSSNTTVTIMYSPAISAGDIYAFEMEYNATLSRWTIFPKIQGKTPCVPPPFMGSGYPRNLAKGSSGQWYIDTDTNFTYICTDVPSGTAENPSTTRTWRCVPSGEGGILTRYLAIVSGPQYYYRSNTTRYTLAVGSIVNQSNTTESLAVGQVTQNNAQCSILVGQSSTQKTSCDTSIAVGQSVFQENVASSVAFGINVRQTKVGDSFTVGVGNVESGGDYYLEGMFEAGIFLTNDLTPGSAYFGMFNAPAQNAVRVTGRGESQNARKNIEELSETGDLYITGGYRQAITEIPDATSAYTLAEGVYIHTPASAPTYTLPAVTDATRTRCIELTVKFINVQSYSFVDSSNTAITPVTTPTISAGDIYTFRMEYSSFLSRWVITPERHGASAYVSDSALAEHTGNTTIHVTSTEKAAWNAKSNFSGSYNDLTNKPTIPSTASDVNAIPVTEKGANNGVATLGSDGKVPAAQLPESGSAVLTGTTNPATTTVGEPGQFYLNTTTPSLFANLRVFNSGTEQDPDLRYVWGKVHTGREVTVGRYIAICDEGLNTIGATSQRVLAVGYSINIAAAEDSIACGAIITQQASTHSSVAIGDTITQSSVQQAIAIGQNITQSYLNGSIAAGENIIQERGSDMIAVGLGLTTNTSYAAYFGKYNAPSSGSLRVTGNGTSNSNRKNIEELSSTGDLYITGGYRQGITVIPAATTAYTLKEGVFTHAPEAAPTYTLPNVTDTARTHRIELTVSFANTASPSFLDSNGNEVPLLYPITILASNIYTFEMEYSSVLNKWIIQPHSQNYSTFIADAYVGVPDGIASLDEDGKVYPSQLPAFTPAPKTGNSAPTTTTEGDHGMLYLRTGNLVYLCTGIYYTGTGQQQQENYSWQSVLAGSGGNVTGYITISDSESSNTLNSQYLTLVIGNNDTQSSSSYSVIAGVQNTQNNAIRSIIVGNNNSQANCNQSGAFGQYITQTGMGDSLVNGVYLNQSNGEAVLMSGIYLTSYGSGEAGASYFGLYNTPVPNVLRVTGNGSSASARKNIEELSTSGDLYITGGYRQAITVIPAATSAYSLAEGVFTHAPSTAPTYTLPAVTDTTRTHRIELTVDFTTVQTYTFVDSESTTVTPVFTPAISAGDIYTFKMEYSSVLSKWLVFPEKHGEGAYISASEKGVANGVATLGASAKVPVTQLPYANITSKGILGAKLNSGLLLNSGELSINPAGETAIDSRNTINPLIPQTLDYAVRSVLPNVSFISALTTDYSLLDSSATTNDHSHIYRHTPDSTTVYRLPEVTTPYLKHVIELIVNFAYTTSYSIVDHNGNAVPLAYPLTVALNDIITFKMEYSSFLSRWVIYPERQGSATFLSESALSSHTSDTTVHVTSAEKTAWNAKSNFSGSYNDLTNKPTVPTALSDLTQTASYRTVTDAEKTEWSGKVSGISLNGEDLEQDEDGIVNISALAVVHTTVPNANTSEQSYMLYLGATNASYKKGHLYERAIEPGTTVAYDRVTVHAYDTEYHFDASNNTTGPWTCNDGNIRLKYEQIGPDTGWWEFTDHTTNDSGYLHNLHSNEVASTDMPWTSAITGWYHEGGNQEIISVTRDVGEEVVPGTDYEWKDLGGSDKEIDEIPSLVTAYSLQEGVARHELGSGYCTYTLPEVRDTSITHEVVVTVMFATATDSCMFLDHDENEIMPLSTPEIEAGTVVSYLCSYDAFLESWAIMPVVYGKKEV